MTYTYRGSAEYHSNPKDHVVCPYGCPEGTLIQKSGASTTLVGWRGGPELDPNHWTMSCTCEGCKRTFVKHWVHSKKTVWYTPQTSGHVLMGKPGCCIPLYYVPCECGGWQVHSTKSKGFIAYKIEDGKSIPQQPMYWSCGACKRKSADHKYGWKYAEESAAE